MSIIFPQPAKNTAVRLALALSCALGMVFCAAGRAEAQVQESRMAELLNPDRTRTSDFAGKTYAASPTVGGKKAQTRAFTFSRSPAFGGSDGTFRTKSFADKGKFGTETFATKADRASGSLAYTGAERGFATKALPVTGARDADKSVPVRKYAAADKSIVIVGKRQGDLDDLYHQKNLSIDDVREILNKPGRGTDAPVQKIGSVPVLPALPVATPAAQ